MIEAKWKCWVYAGRKTVFKLQEEQHFFIHNSGKFLDDNRKEGTRYFSLVVLVTAVLAM